MTEGLGAGAAVAVGDFIASLPSLNFKVVVPVGAATVEHLPSTGCWIGEKEQRPPEFVLLDMDTFMRAKNLKLLLRNGNDDMPKDDGPEGQPVGKLAATGLGGPVSDFKSACGPLGTAAEKQRNCSQQETNRRTG